MPLGKKHKYMQSVHINGIFNEHQNKFICQSWEKKYIKKIMGNKKHLQREYGLTSLEECEQNDTRVDYVAIYHASYIKCALLPRDINNAYKMADSDRVLSTAKFQMLLSRSGSDTKYRLWLFRYMAYRFALLSPYMVYVELLS